MLFYTPVDEGFDKTVCMKCENQAGESSIISFPNIKQDSKDVTINWHCETEFKEKELAQIVMTKTMPYALTSTEGTLGDAFDAYFTNV